MATEENEYDKQTIVNYMGWNVFNNHNKNTTIKYEDAEDFNHLKFVLDRMSIVFKNSKDKNYVTVKNREWE